MKESVTSMEHSASSGEQSRAACMASRTVRIQDSMICIRVPMRRVSKGRQTLILPAASSLARNVAARPAPDTTMVKALARAWYWQRLLDNGKYSSAQVLAKKHGVHLSDVCRVLQLNLLGPSIRKAILDGAQPRTMNLEMFKKSWPDVWTKQWTFFGFNR